MFSEPVVHRRRSPPSFTPVARTAAPMTTPTPFAHSIGVVIGIDHYGNGVPELRTAANDARRLGELLRDRHGYDITAILDADATQARITALLTKELPARVGPDDRVLFYFAGHGVAHDSDEGPNGYLLPVDAKRGDETTYLDMPLVHDALLALTCRHMLIVLDSCFSGAFRWSGTRDVEDVVDVVHQEKFDRYVRDPAWQVITSASQDQKALDQLSAGSLGSRDGDGAHSPFALALFDGLSGKGDVIPRDGGDGLVTATELYLYLDEALQSAAIAAGKNQTPRLWPLKKHDKGEFVFFVPDRVMTLPPAPPLTFDNNPWRGLASYDAAQSALFFGRDTEIAALRTKVEATPLTVVLGASGTGKSSLVKAGVVPRLVADGALVLPIVRPGSTPLVAIAQALGADGTPAVAATAEAISARTAALVNANAGKKIVLVIDQFEELITLVRTKAERDEALGLLASLSAMHADALRIVVTIRTDFEPNFDRSAFGDRWRNGRYVVPPMSRENLRAVIEKPATARVLYFDPSNLVDALVDEVVATPGALPLLSFALSEMYIAYVKRQGSDRAITRADYDGLGGVAGALRARAESEYAALDDAHKATLRRVMLRLVTSEGGGLARRRVMDTELDFANSDEQARAANVVQRLTAARLLVEGKEPDGEAFVEPAHDALVRGWGRLLEWVREENEAKFPLLQQQKLARSADEWDRSAEGAKSGLLWSDSSRSAQLIPLVRQRAPFFNRREMAFAQRSVRGRRIAIWTVVAALLTIALAGVAAVIGASRALARAEQVRIGAIVRTATAMVGDDPLVAAQLLGSIDSAMVTTLDNATSLSLLGAALELRRAGSVVRTFDTGDEVTHATISPDGRTVATVTLDNVVRLWRTDGSAAPIVLPGDSLQVLTLRFTAASDRIAIGNNVGRILIWHVDGSGGPVVLQSDSTAVTGVQFSRDGRALLVQHQGGAVHVWRTASPGPEATPNSAPILLASGSGVEQAELADDDRQVVALMDDRSVQIWPTSGQRRSTRTVRLPKNEDVARIAVSPDGRRVLLGGLVRQLEVLDLSARTPPLRLVGHSRSITAIGWSPDGSEVVSTAGDNTIRTWNAADGTTVNTFRYTGETIRSVRFSPDGRAVITFTPYTFQPTVWLRDQSTIDLPGHTRELVTAEFVTDSRHVFSASRDGSVRLWQLPAAPFYDAAGIGDPKHPEGGDIASAAFSPDSRTVAFSTKDGLVFARSVDTGSALARLDSTLGTMHGLAFSADGRRLNGLRYDGVRRSWQRSVTPAVRTDTPSPLAVNMQSSDFSADARHVLARSDSGEALIWDFDTPTPPMRLQLLPRDSLCDTSISDCVGLEEMCVTLSGDGRLAAACTRAGPVALFRVPDTLPFRTVRSGSRKPSVLAISHDTLRLAIGYDDGSIRVVRLDVADTGRVFTGHRQSVKLLEFAPDDRRLLSASFDGTVTIRDLGTSGTAVVTIRPKGLVIDVARFTADGTRLFTLGFGESEARLWNVDGSGGSVGMRVTRRAITGLYLSPDARWVLISTNGRTAELLPLDINTALAPYRALRTCMLTTERQRYLMESARDAAARNTACMRSRNAPEPRTQR